MASAGLLETMRDATNIGELTQQHLCKEVEVDTRRDQEEVLFLDMEEGKSQNTLGERRRRPDPKAAASVALLLILYKVSIMGGSLSAFSSVAAAARSTRGGCTRRSAESSIAGRRVRLIDPDAEMRTFLGVVVPQRFPLSL